jgi:2-keto-4-pentenoate hydratase/2-oxohepta-3-ene-1,7-dioic acid hydratase in catechol pathway
MMSYHHRWINGDLISLTPSKIVCIGRNYAEHARELNNPITTEPMLFMKPVTSMVDMTEPIIIDWEKAKAFDGSCPLSAFEPIESFLLDYR